MSNSYVYRYDAPVTEQRHHAINKSLGGSAGDIIKYAPDTDATDFGAGATGNVMNAASDGTGEGTVGTYIACDGKSRAYFKIEYGAATGTRRFHAVFKDQNGTTTLYFVGLRLEPMNLGRATSVRVGGYYHGEGLVVECLGWKEVTLWLDDDLTAPSVHVWGVAV